MSDKKKDIDDMTEEEVVDGLVSELDRIYTHLLDHADELHKSLQSDPMTDAEIWESLIPPFED